MSELDNNTPASIDEGIPEVNFEVEVSNVVQAPIDPTLKIEGMAADAKATGDAIDALDTELSGDIDALNTKLSGDIDALDTKLQREIDAIDTGVDSVPGRLFPVGAIYVSTSADPPTFGGENWNWQEILLPVTQGDLMDGTRSYEAKDENADAGTLHFWLRIADTEVSA